MSLPPRPAPVTAAGRSTSTYGRYVSVLWDLENVTPSGTSAVDIVAGVKAIAGGLGDPQADKTTYAAFTNGHAFTEIQRAALENDGFLIFEQADLPEQVRPGRRRGADV